ncbi:MAG: branched-chain amino acid ABC transporter permease [Betaproteobacteria bacterium]|nr:MAG: branched-chain amino acid ABC transporter permease [Betaproteobacteria bacterium]
MDMLLQVLVIGLLLGGIYGLVSIGLNLIFGVIRIVNFAQGELVMLGMYGAYLAYATMGLDPYIATLIVMPALFVLGVIVYRLVLQPLASESSMQIFATFALLLIFQNVVLAITRGEGYSVSSKLAGVTFGIGDIRVTMSRLAILIAVTLTAIALHFFLKRTMIGKSIRAVTQDRQAARLMGINVERTFMITFGIGSALAGLAGALLSPIYTMSPGIGGNFILAAFAVVVLGGLGSVAGAYFGGIIVGLVEALAGFYVDPELKQAIWFLIFLAVLIMRPTGLFGQVGAEEVGFREQA